MRDLAILLQIRQGNEDMNEILYQAEYFIVVIMIVVLLVL